MASFPICRFPDDTILRGKAKKVSRVNASVQWIVSSMIETMQKVNGIGLAAPQIGVPLRIVVLQMPGEDPFVLINPEVVERAGEQEVTEGCLSVPGYYGKIKRPAELVVEGKNEQGKMIRIEASGLLAEALDHEIDHLDGRLYIDHVESKDSLHKVKSMDYSSIKDMGR
jgi:peptide deformylase